MDKKQRDIKVKALVAAVKAVLIHPDFDEACGEFGRLLDSLDDAYVSLVNLLDKEETDDT